MGIAIALRSLACSFFMIELLPDNYALAVGLGNIGCAFSTIFWSWVPLLVINPDNATAGIKIREYNRAAYYFGEAVTTRVPYLFRVITIISIVAVLLPLLLIRNPPWLCSMFDKLLYGHVQRMDLKPNISVRAPPATKPMTPHPIEIMSDSKTSIKIPHDKTTLETDELLASPDPPQTQTQLDEQYKNA